MAIERKDRPLVIRFRLTGARGTLAAFNKVGKQANAELRQAAGSLAAGLAIEIRSAGARAGRQAGPVATTVNVRRDRVPFISVGGSRVVSHHRYKGRGRARAGDLLFGSEFGARGDSNKFAPFGYREHTGRSGTWIFPTVEANHATIAAAWDAAAADILSAFVNAPIGPTEVI